MGFHIFSSTDKVEKCKPQVGQTLRLDVRCRQYAIYQVSDQTSLFRLIERYNNDFYSRPRIILPDFIFHMFSHSAAGSIQGIRLRDY
ncbi:MAG: hypothetical protein DYH16_08420 [Nitrosomonas sp. PRO5]|nr:hypothetical protein [Nitrosomonas sp. PRO5]